MAVKGFASSSDTAVPGGALCGGGIGRRGDAETPVPGGEGSRGGSRQRTAVSPHHRLSAAPSDTSVLQFLLATCAQCLHFTHENMQVSEGACSPGFSAPALLTFGTGALC